MKREDIWGTIKDNILLIITVVGGVFTAIAYPLGWIPQSVILSVIVGLLTLFITSEIFERRQRFSRLESLVEGGFTKVITSLDGVEVQSFPTEKDTYEYIVTYIQKFEGNIMDASLGPSSETIPEYRRKYYEIRGKAISKGKIHYRYITMFNNRTRLDRVRQEIRDLGNKQFYVGYFDIPAKPIPIFSFAVLGNKEVIVGGHRRMYAPSERSPDLLIRHPAIVQLFSDYFDLLWQRSIKLNERGIREDLLDSLSKGIESDKHAQSLDIGKS
jgi:hypothetical protein